MPTQWTDTELAYFAGILDGEGCLGLTRTTKRGYPRHHARITVTNTSDRLIRWLATHFGGTVCLRKSRPHRNPRSNYLTWRPCWEWKCQEKQVDAILTAVMPYLVEKQDRAALLLEFRATIQHKGDRKLPTALHIIEKRDDLQRQLRALNARGIAS